MRLGYRSKSCKMESPLSLCPSSQRLFTARDVPPPLQQLLRFSRFPLTDTTLARPARWKSKTAGAHSHLPRHCQTDWENRTAVGGPTGGGGGLNDTPLQAGAPQTSGCDCVPTKQWQLGRDDLAELNNWRVSLFGVGTRAGDCCRARVPKPGEFSQTQNREQSNLKAEKQKHSG